MANKRGLVLGIALVSGLLAIALTRTKGPVPPPEQELVVPPLKPTDPGRPPPCGHYGDLDNDGLVTIRDAALLEAWQAGKLTLEDWQLVRANVAESRAVQDPWAVTWIRAYAEGRVNTFPVCV